MIDMNNIKLKKVFQIDNYEYNNYLVYVMENENDYEFYLQNRNYGIIALMYGVPKTTNKDILESYNFDEYIQEYQERYEDLEEEY